LIEFRNVSMTYKTGIYALKNVSFKVMDGEFVFVIGRSGSGKSTLIKLLTCEENPVSGNVFVDNYEISFLKRSLIPYLRRNIGMVFQDFRLIYSKTVYENVAFAMEIIGASKKLISTRVPIVLSIVGLRDKAQMKPNQLSGGEQQRVAIARAMVNNPMLILADEPTGNLDPENSESIMALLEDINCGGTTIMVCTHDSSIVNKMRRRVIEIADGFLVRDELLGEYNLAIGCDFKKNKQKIRSEISVNNKAKKKAKAKIAATEPFVRNINIKFSEEDFIDNTESATEKTAEDIDENPAEDMDSIIGTDNEIELLEEIEKEIDAGTESESEDTKPDSDIQTESEPYYQPETESDNQSETESDNQSETEHYYQPETEPKLNPKHESEHDVDNISEINYNSETIDEIEIFPIQSNKNGTRNSDNAIGLSGAGNIENINEILGSIRNSKDSNSTLYSIEIEDTQGISLEEKPDFANMIRPKRVPAPGKTEDL
jgi:cell division transport system ATP-binding protein